MHFVNFKLLLQRLQSKTPELELRVEKYLVFILNESLKASLRVRKPVHLDVSGNYVTFLSE